MSRTLLTFLLFITTISLLSAQWLAGWSHRQTIEITEISGNNLSNYQIRVDVLIQPNMQADFADLRFTTNDGTTLIDYWIEFSQAGSDAVVWVEVPTLAASSVDSIYLYYGNPGVPSLSNGTATFVFFDDFTNFSGWTNYSGGAAAHDTTTFSGMRVLRKENSCDPAGMWKTIGTTVTSFRMISRETRTIAFTDCPWNRYGMESAGFNGYTIRRNADQANATSQFGFERRNNGNASNAVESNLPHPRGVWYRTELTKDCANNAMEAILFDDNKVLIGSEAGTDNAYCSFERVTVRGGRNYHLDYMAIANYITDNPQISISTPTPILLSFDLLNFDARYTKEGNLLTWELEQVDEIANFEVHYSADAMTFERLREQDVVGTQYDCLDPNYRTGRIAYYRLMATMKDGSVEYSEIKAVELPQKQHTLTLLPNPTSSNLQVIFEIGQANPLQVLILNANGQVVAQYTEQGVAGEQKIVLDVSELPSGLYNLMLSDGLNSRTRRFLKE
ncbi:MAG: DUF2341 domain-containing protein [Aureispira sp.]